MSSLENYLVKAQRARAAQGAFNYIDMGEYLLETNSCAFAGDKTQVLAYEGKVLWTDNVTNPRMRVGTIVHHAVAVNNVMFESAMKAMLLALTGESEEAIDAMPKDDYLQLGKAVFEEQACSGTLIRCSATETESKGKGKTPKGEMVPVRTFSFFGEAKSPWEIGSDGYPVLKVAA